MRSCAAGVRYCSRFCSQTRNMHFRYDLLYKNYTRVYLLPLVIKTNNSGSQSLKPPPFHEKQNIFQRPTS